MGVHILPLAGAMELGRTSSRVCHIRHNILMPLVIACSVDCSTCASKLCALHSFCIIYHCAQTCKIQIVTLSEPSAVSLLLSVWTSAVESPLVSLGVSLHLLYVSICVLLNILEPETSFQKLAHFTVRNQNRGRPSDYHVCRVCCHK